MAALGMSLTSIPQVRYLAVMPSCRLTTSLVAASLILAGCGVGALSKEEYVAQLRPLCEEAGDTNSDIFDQVAKSNLTTPDGQREALGKARSALDAQKARVNEMAKLKGPEEDRSRLDAALFAPLRSKNDATDRFLESVERFIETQDATNLEAPAPDATGDASFLRAYGLNDCARIIGS